MWNPAGRIFAMVMAALFAGVLAAAQAADRPQVTQAQQQPRQFRIGAQDLSGALKAFALQSQREIFFAPELTAGKRSPGIEGKYEDLAALSALLGNTGLTYSITSSNAILVRDPRSAEPQASAQPAEGLRIARAADETAGTPPRSGADGKQTNTAEAAPNSSGEREMVVTGTHMRGIGIESIASPVFSYDRESIENSGVGTIAEYMQTLPQNFSWGISESQVSAGGGGGTYNPNDQALQSVNLRGLGPDATLLLVNGRRLSNAGSSEAPSISLLPAAVIERIDIIADGSSAIYGADAVGGVVNIVTRRDFNGMELRARGATVTSGSRREYQGGATAGRSWSGGSAFIDINASRRDPLGSEERDFTQPRPSAGEFDLLPGDELLGIYGSVSHSVGNVRLSLDGSYGDRTVEYRQAFNGSRHLQYNEGYTLAGGLAWPIGERMSVDAFVDFSELETSRASRFLNGSAWPPYDTSNRLLVAEAILRSEGFALPGGLVRLAAGVQMRRQEFSEVNASDPLESRGRDVNSVFGEVFVPLVGEGQKLRLARSVSLVVAGRYEDFSDFGDTFVPRAGLRWALSEALSLRGTYSRSFVAPSLRQVYGPAEAYFYGLADAGLNPAQQDPRFPAGQSFVAFLYGSNPGLVAQDADTYTAGFDFSTSGERRFSFGGGVYSAEFSNRIFAPNPFQMLLTSDWASLVSRPPTAAQLGTLFSEPSIGFISNESPVGNPGEVTAASQLGFNLNEVQVFMDARSQNIAVERTQGLDFYARYAAPLGAGRLSLELSGQHILELRRQLAPGQGFVARENTVFNPPELAAKLTAGWSLGSIRMSAGLNHIGKMRDNRAGLAGDIGAFATVDLSLRWTPSSAPLDVETLLTVRNALDEPPPRIAAEEAGYDVYNANGLGRVVGLSFTLRF